MTNFTPTEFEEAYLEKCKKWLQKTYRGHANFHDMRTLFACYNVFNGLHLSAEQINRLEFAAEYDKDFRSYLALLPRLQRECDETFLPTETQEE